MGGWGGADSPNCVCPASWHLAAASHWPSAPEGEEANIHVGVRVARGGHKNVKGPRTVGTPAPATPAPPCIKHAIFCRKMELPLAYSEREDKNTKVTSEKPHRTNGGGEGGSPGEGITFRKGGHRLPTAHQHRVSSNVGSQRIFLLNNERIIVAALHYDCPGLRTGGHGRGYAVRCVANSLTNSHFSRWPHEKKGGGEFQRCRRVRT